MRISSIHIQNFRAFKDETISFDDYTCFVGPNGSGKSTVLMALNVFFRDTANSATDLVNLSREDFYGHITTEPIKITVTFEELGEAAKAELSDYARQEKLIVSAIATWDERSQTALVKQFGQRLGIKDFALYFEKEKGGASSKELQEFYAAELRKRFPNLPDAKTKPKMEEALRDFEDKNRNLLELIQSEDRFYGVSRGTNRIQPYLQWVYVPAVKDASSESVESKNTAIGKLLARRVHGALNLTEPLDGLKRDVLEKYGTLLKENSSALQLVAEAISNRFRQWAHEGASVTLAQNPWHQLPRYG